MGEHDAAVGEFGDDLQWERERTWQDALNEMKDGEEHHQIDADEEHGASAFENGVSECGEECGHVVSGGCRTDLGLSGEGQQDESAEDLNAIERPADLGRAI